MSHAQSVLTALLVVIALALCPASLRAADQQLILNGDFEQADLLDWSVDTSVLTGAGDISVSSDSFSPLSGWATAGPASGSWYAVMDQDFGSQGAYSLSQSFIVPENTTALNLSFDLFVDNHSGLPPDLAAVAIPRGLFKTILERIRRLKPPSVVFT